MMHLVARWAQLHAPHVKLLVATVDHGLRAESRDEAEWVAREARALGLQHETLTWTDAKPATGIQDAAREARYRLLSELARRFPAPVAIVTAHTEDDQAETLLMRLARGSGLDGLTAMAEHRAIGEGCVLLRPLLGVSGARLRQRFAPRSALDRGSEQRRRSLRACAPAQGARAAREPRAHQRQDRAQCAPSRARARCARCRRQRLEAAARLDLHGGAFASFAQAVWLAAPEELRLRLLGGLIASYGGQAEPLRLAQLEALVDRLASQDFEGATLAGAIVSRHGGRRPRPARARAGGAAGGYAAPGSSAVWDGRFRVSAAADASGPVEVRALGTQAFADLRQQLDMPRGLPAQAAATLPAFWRAGELITVPAFAALPGVSPAWGTAMRLYSAEFLG